MTTTINVLIDENGLLNKANLQRMVNRKALELMEKRKELERETLEKLKEQRRALGQDAETGKPLPSEPSTALGNTTAADNRIQYDPAANRNNFGAGGRFGFYTVLTEFPEVAEPLNPPADSNVKFKQLRSLAEVNDGFAAVFIGTRNACFTYNSEAWFGGHLSRLAAFARQGGIVVINSEWTIGGCGNKAPRLALDINRAFGTGIKQNDGIQDLDDAVAVNLASPRLASFMPGVARVDASATFSGGTPLYRKDSFVTSAYQKVGSGVLVRWGDSNETGLDPLAKLSPDGRGRLVSLAEGLVAWQRSNVR